jgi:hypothetical protein
MEYPPVPVATSTSPKRLLIARLIACFPAAIFVLAVAGSMEGNAGSKLDKDVKGVCQCDLSVARSLLVAL